jgi:outer membrane receptor protein involved in Fe transport
MQKVLKSSMLAACLLLIPVLAFTQGVTTSAINGTVADNNRQGLPGANVVAVHEPSGSVFGAVSRVDGRFNIPGIRVGGPYSVTASLIGHKPQKRENVYLTLGQDLKIDFVLPEEAVEIGEVQVVAERDAIMSASRTGAATSVSREAIASLPTISRRIEDIARLTPQYNPSGFGFSFAGQDNRLNNVTVDGSYFNNSFGLAGQPGDRTGVSPISLDAVEQLQINIAPYDVRQGNFVGAGVNTVTKSGTNQFSGSLYLLNRDEGLVGKEARGAKVNVGTFKYNQIGVRLGGPIIKNKLFFFADYENDELTQPGTTFTTRTSTSQAVTGNTTRVLDSDLVNLSRFLKDSLGYETGPYQGYDNVTPSKRFIAKVDFNLNNRNKLSVRYNHLDSDTDVLVSNSNSLGLSTSSTTGRRSGTTALNFQNSNYIILENIRSLVGEWNSTLGNNMANNLIVGYSHHDESRDSRGAFFPFVDIHEAGQNYTAFGFEPFTPNNELRYKSFQVQNNFTIYGPKHNLTFGASVERYDSENVFFPGSQSVYVYNSLADFYRDARDYVANPNRTSSPVALRRFQVRFNNIPGQEKPIQPLEVLYAGVYGQDEWQFSKNLRLTLGLRVDVPRFGNTGYTNALADQLSFRQEDGSTIQYQTGKLPDASLLWSPRLGFNWDVSGDRTTQIRGGSGIFTGRPAYVWISNQIGNTGVLTGFESLDNIPAGRAITAGGRPFNPDPNRYKPTNVTGAPAASYELALTDPDFKFPQLWRSNIAIDRELPFFGLIGTAEFLYSRDVNGIYYINANLPAAQTSFNGVDNRQRWFVANLPAGQVANRINQNVANATVLKNQNEGYSWNFSAAVEKPFSGGFFGKVAYSYGDARNTVDPGSIAAGSWTGNAQSNDPNNPGLGYSLTAAGHRFLAALTYRKDYFNFGATTISLYGDAYSFGRESYIFSGDLNGDGATNDLIYIPRDASEMNFEQYTFGSGATARTFTVAEQQAAWEAFIQKDKYLSANRGKYAERNGVRRPMVFRADLSIVQDVFTNISGTRNGLQFRVDFLNFTNLVNKDWGVSQRLTTNTPLIARGADAQGRVLYRLNNLNSNQLISEPLQHNAGITTGDVFRIQLGFRYNFN